MHTVKNFYMYLYDTKFPHIKIAMQWWWTLQ